MNFIRYIVIGTFWAVAAAGYPAADSLAFYADQYHYSACVGDVPIRRTPDMASQRIATIPKGVAVKVDKEQDRWVRVIYKIREGYYIGWSLAALLCPIQSSNSPSIP